MCASTHRAWETHLHPPTEGKRLTRTNRSRIVYVVCYCSLKKKLSLIRFSTNTTLLSQSIYIAKHNAFVTEQTVIIHRVERVVTFIQQYLFRSTKQQDNQHKYKTLEVSIYSERRVVCIPNSATDCQHLKEAPEQSAEMHQKTVFFHRPTCFNRDGSECTNFKIKRKTRHAVFLFT